MPRIQIENLDDDSQYDLNVPSAPGVGDVLLVHDPGSTTTRLVLLVTEIKGAVFQVRGVSTSAAGIVPAEAC
jgi:hypothetical protein